jgi:hypothetical protein
MTWVIKLQIKVSGTSMTMSLITMVEGSPLVTLQRNRPNLKLQTFNQLESHPPQFHLQEELAKRHPDKKGIMINPG